MAENVASTENKPASQVRISLSTKQPDVSLAQNPGPILVNTSEQQSLHTINTSD